jgi:alanine racemase
MQMDSPADLAPLVSPENRPNWIEIDLDALRGNIAFIRSRLAPVVKILLPVKADAYGHGSLAASYTAEASGVDYLGVAHPFEGADLREHGVRLPILVLGACQESEFPLLVQHDLTPSIASLDIAKKLNHFLEAGMTGDTPDPVLKVHLQVDTGMNRFGVPASDFAEAEAICRLPHLEVEGMYSHLATADEPGSDFLKLQVKRFTELKNYLTEKNLCPPICHLANSPATLLYDDLYFDMVRPGIALYGYSPLGDFPPPWPIRPVLKLRSTVRRVHAVRAGEGISYGQLWKAGQDTLVATIALGYGDGYLRGAPNTGMVLVRGVACPILGRVCMDACMVDLSAVPDAETVRQGEVVDCIDGALDARISMEQIAKERGTISYEITTRMARRLYRLYRYEGRLLRWDEVMPILRRPAVPQPQSGQKA